jgi:molecular chaperone GrpE
VTDPHHDTPNKSPGATAPGDSPDLHRAPAPSAPGDAANGTWTSPHSSGEDGPHEPTAADARVEAAAGLARPVPEPSGEEDAQAAEVLADVDELTRLSAQRDEYLALAQRTHADFENYRKRMAREAKAAEARGVARLAKELLPALDNLERAASAADAEDPLLAGVRLVHAELTAGLKRLGIESYSPAGERFDPAAHEAMAQQPVDGTESGTVVEVYQPGYRMTDSGNVIRPARVVVAA